MDGSTQIVHDLILTAVPYHEVALPAKGRITRLDASDAEKMPGVVAILHRENMLP